MARKKPANPKRAPAPPPEMKATRRTLSPRWMSVGLFAFAFLLYAQTISFQYALDDQPTLRDNAIVHKGFAGIPELLKTDFWHGSDIGVVVPLYRPASLILFAMEWQFFPGSPAFYHLINVLLYAFTCALLFLLLRRVLSTASPVIPLACVLLYAAHPLHTEVVSNIKSADELLCFLFVILSSWFALDFAVKKSIAGLVLSALFFFFALLSKESGIVLFLVVPLILYFFTTAGWKPIVSLSAVYFLPIALYFFMRSNALEGIAAYAESPLVNTLYAAPDWIGQRATAVYILLRYIGLLLYPHPLSYTYDFNEVKVQEISSPLVLFSAALHIALLILALAWFRKKHIVSFAILFYLVTLAPVSNVFLTIGSPMAERFLYIPSLGFCLVIAWLVAKTGKQGMEGGKPRVPVRVVVIAGLLVAVYSVKTLARSRDWENNKKLFGTDVITSPGSAPAHYHWGNALVSLVYEEAKDSAAAHAALDQAAFEYKEAVRIFPGYNDAYLHLGNVYAKKSDPVTAIAYFEKYNEMAGPNNVTVLQYLGILYDKTGRYDKSLESWRGVARISGGADVQAWYYMGLMLNKQQQYSEALACLDTALRLDPNHVLARKNKALALLNTNQNDLAMAECDTLLLRDPNYAKAYCYKGFACINKKDYRSALGYLEKAMQLDPSDKECESRLVVLRQMEKAGTL